MIVYDKKHINDVSCVGGKGLGLGKLTAYGLNVPDYFVITAGTDMYNDDFAAELEVFAANLHCASFAVRSSSINEDAVDGSFAGQYSTELNVSHEDLLNAVRRVAASGVNAPLERYAKHFDTQSKRVAVIVQKQIHGEYSGVMFTTSPYCSDERIIESVHGEGEKLVSGLVVPEGIIFKKNNPPQEGFFKQLSDIANMLEEKEGYPLDIEWTFEDNRLWLLQMRPLTAVGDSLPSIPDRKWNLYVYRDFCPFVHGVQRIASQPFVQTETFGFAVPIAEGLLVCGREFYSPENDVIIDGVWKALDKEGFFDNFIKRIKSSVHTTCRRANALKNRACDTLGIKELFKLYKREIKAYIASYVPLMMRPDDYLYNKLIDLVGEEKAEKLVGIASAACGKTYYASERSDFISTIINGNVDDYIDKYEWICNPLGKITEGLTRERYFKRAEGITVALAEEKLRQIKAMHVKAKNEREAVIKELDVNECNLLETISQFIFLRTYTAENSDRYFYYIRKKILANICIRLGISEDELLLMSPEEVQRAEFGFRLSAHEIAKRKSGETTIITNGESSVFFTGKSYALLKKLIPEEVCGEGFALKGKIACMGEVSAKVKIVNNMSQADNFEEGCILVTTMTVPEITAALDKACGIITDEGGITCHAAIIAREYAIPCLVGTKNATTVLKDGVYVKLDCINGRVIIEG